MVSLQVRVASCWECPFIREHSAPVGSRERYECVAIDGPVDMSYGQVREDLGIDKECPLRKQHHTYGIL